jgi:serine/threonine protein kinase
MKLNELDFTQHNRVKQRVHVSTHPEVNAGKPVLSKLAVWPWEIPSMDTETAIYQRISDSGVGPRFLGHLTEGKDGRVVASSAEWVEGARPAGPEDIDGCKKALGMLHQLGIKLGDINPGNFLVRDGHDVVLVDFETAKRDCSPVELRDEMNALKGSLEVESHQDSVEHV